jgi:hypothetical protein
VLLESAFVYCGSVFAVSVAVVQFLISGAGTIQSRFSDDLLYEVLCIGIKLDLSYKFHLLSFRRWSLIYGFGFRNKTLSDVEDFPAIRETLKLTSSRLMIWDR